MPPETTLERAGRYEGHLFLVVTDAGHFTEPDRLPRLLNDRRPGETAFVLARLEANQSWRYCGVARWLDDEGQWSLPPLDFASWRARSQRSDCSRRLLTSALDRAKTFLNELVSRIGAGSWLAHGGKRCRVVERTAGGVRIEGGEGGFAARRVSTTDLAWVILAADGVAEHGGVLDEVRVNRLRYLEGTPRKSTRWIDTGWAIVLFGGVAGG